MSDDDLTANEWLCVMYEVRGLMRGNNELIQSRPSWSCKTVSGCLGKDGPTKTDEFLEKFQKGGGSFPIQKFMLQIFAIINAS